MSDSILSSSDPFDEPTMRTMRGGAAAAALGRIDQYELVRKLGPGRAQRWTRALPAQTSKTCFSSAGSA